jgi:3'-phosphoadenosine 5'-phosphosulfate sulfotransferase (PAPS reductase)/FAD synthetase
VWQNIRSIVPEAYARALVEETARLIGRRLASTGARRVAFAWSGGKDSLALEVVMQVAGIRPCLMGICELEYPEFLRWVTRHMPDELEVINTGLDLPWLAQNADLLFPQDASTAARWFRLIQHTAQEQYFKTRNLDVLILGRRHADGNFTGLDGMYANRQGVVRYSPLRYWTHEDVLAVCAYCNVQMPPGYSWPNGFVVGTGAWPARQWTRTPEQGWREVFQIDPSIVEQAAPYLPSARTFLETVG